MTSEKRIPLVILPRCDVKRHAPNESPGKDLTQHEGTGVQNYTAQGRAQYRWTRGGSQPAVCIGSQENRWLSLNCCKRLWVWRPNIENQFRLAVAHQKEFPIGCSIWTTS